MGSHPANLALRFILAIAALVAMGLWVWRQGEGATRLVYAALVPLGAATIWGVFAVPGDPSRSGLAPIPVPGVLRLSIEIAFFSFAVWALSNLGKNVLAATMAAVVTVHYVISYDRIAWLLRT